MWNRLTNRREVELARRRLAVLLASRGEWLVRERGAGVCVEFGPGDWELDASARALVFSFEKDGRRVARRVVAWESRGEMLRLAVARRAGAGDGATLELFPRASVAAMRARVEDARRALAERTASLVRDSCAGARIVSVKLSAGARRGEPGRYARILLLETRDDEFRETRGELRETRDGLRKTQCGLTAVTGPVVPLRSDETDAFIASSWMWFSRLENGVRGERARSLRLVVPQALSAACAERAALLRDDVRSLISILEVDDELKTATAVRAPALSEMLEGEAPRLVRPARARACELVESIVSCAPCEVDVVRSRRGETLRFNGLAFARVRRVKGSEAVWFGVEAAPRRRLLDETNGDELLKLIEELKAHRRADAPDRAHALYRAAPEAWLESILRRDITRLDPGLRLAPLYAQFRADGERDGRARPVDLLALRRDGRLVVIELKVTEDAAHALQGAGYWRHVELQRRAGHIQRARLFGDAAIADAPALVYLVAPTLRYHLDFTTIARIVSPEIECYRFDLNEDWRAGVRVMRRERLA